MKKFFATMVACAMAFTCAVPAFANDTENWFNFPGYVDDIDKQLAAVRKDPLGSDTYMDSVFDYAQIVKDGSKVKVTNPEWLGTDEYLVSVNVFKPAKAGTKMDLYDIEADKTTNIDVGGYLMFDGEYIIKDGKAANADDVNLDDTKHWSLCKGDNSDFDGAYKLKMNETIEFELPNNDEDSMYALNMFSVAGGEIVDYFAINVVEETDYAKLAGMEVEKVPEGETVEVEPELGEMEDIVVGNTGFKDVDDNAYYAKAVEWAVDYGITSGTDVNVFSPDASCTRAQAVTFLYRAAGCPEVEGADNHFTDVPETSYYKNAIMWAVQNGITSGTSETTFSPDAPCTRAQIVTFLCRAYKTVTEPAEVDETTEAVVDETTEAVVDETTEAVVDETTEAVVDETTEAVVDETTEATTEVEVTTATKFTDVPEGAYYGDAIQWAVDEGVTSGTSDTTFSPDDVCTRAQIVTFMFRTINK